MSRKIHLLPFEFQKAFIIGGQANLSVLSKLTGKWLAFFIMNPTRRNEDLSHLRFVYTRTSEPSNGFFGTIFLNEPNTPFRTSRKAKIPFNDIHITAFHWIWQQMVSEIPMKDAELYHVNLCGRCGYTLTDPPSIVTGFGTHCRKELGLRTLGRKELRSLGYNINTKGEYTP